MPTMESVFTNLLFFVLKSLGIWWVLQRINRARLCRIMSEIARSYSDAPKLSEDVYATLIVLFRYPQIRETNEISVNTKRIFDVDKIRNIHERCSDLFSAEQNQSITSLLRSASSINKHIELINLKSENIEAQKNAARQMLIDWCFVLFLLGKIGSRGSKFMPLNKDTKDFNDVIRKRFGVTLDEDQLFEAGLSKYGVKILDSNNT